MTARSAHRLLAGALLAVPIATAGYHAGALARSGALASIAVGTFVFAGGGVGWSIPLLGFFVSASLLTRLRARWPGRQSPQPLAPDKPARTATQVAANGGLAALAGLLQLRSAQRRDWTLLFLGAVATAAADTWATELGTLSPHPPRSLRTGRPVPPGTSGAVSPLGTLAMVAGASLVAALAPRSVPRWPVVVAGCVGALADSLLGATLQARYRCAHCGRTVEAPGHDCPGPVERVSGLAGFTNDAVNAAATVTGALTAALFGRFSRRAA